MTAAKIKENEPDEDYWTHQGDYVIRVHEQPRREYFRIDQVPPDQLPVPLEELDDWMRVEKVLPYLDNQTVELTWQGIHEDRHPEHSRNGLARHGSVGNHHLKDQHNQLVAGRLPIDEFAKRLQ